MLRMRHQAEDVPGRVDDSGDVRDRTVRVLARGVAQHDLAAGLELVERALRRAYQHPRRASRGSRAPARRRSGTGSAPRPARRERRTSGRRTAARGSARRTPGRSPASQRIWKPLQMPSTGPPSAANRATARHHGREARDRAAAQVVAVGEAARAGRPPPTGGQRRSPHARRARPLRRGRSSASAASRSSFEPGKTTTATGAGASVIRDLLEDRRSRSSRSAGSRAVRDTSRSISARASAAPPRRPRDRSPGRRGASRRRSRGGRATPRTASPCGSRIPAFGRTSTVALIEDDLRVGRRTSSNAIPVIRSKAST